MVKIMPAKIVAAIPVIKCHFGGLLVIIFRLFKIIILLLMIDLVISTLN